MIPHATRPVHAYYHSRDLEKPIQLAELVIGWERVGDEYVPITLDGKLARTVDRNVFNYVGTFEHYEDGREACIAALTFLRGPE